MTLRHYALVILLSIFAVMSATISMASPMLLALSKQEHALSIVDPATLQVVARIPVGDDPHEVVASADGRTAYVSNYGFGAYHTITIVDLAARKPQGVIDLGALHGPHGLCFAQGKLWFTAEVAKVIGSYDPAAGKMDWVMGTGQNRTHMLYVFPDANRIVTTNVNSGTITIFEKREAPGGPPKPGSPPVSGYPQGAVLPPGGDWHPDVIAVGTRDEGFDVSPDGKEIWVANAGDGTVSIVNVASKAVSATLNLQLGGANRLKFTPDGKRVLISRLNAPDLTVIDTATHQAVKRISIGQGSAGILVQPDGARAYVACSPDGYVAVIDLKTLEVVGHVDAGGNPDGLAWAASQ